MKDLKAGGPQELSSESSDESTHKAELINRRKSMKINTIGLDI